MDVVDVRFPTSLGLHGSDAMNPDPDYSAAYVVLRTESGDGLEGHGLTFTIGRGTEVCVAAAEALRPMVVGRDTDDLFADLGGFWRQVTGDSQLRWIGPEKGAMHMATAAVVNAVWDLCAKAQALPVWRLLAQMTPAQLVDLVDFRYLADAIDPGSARERLEEQRPSRAQRISLLESDGLPAYTTSVGWLGYDDETVARLCKEAVAEGWTHLKMKVGADPADDLRRAELIRGAIGPDVRLMMDANQRWDVGTAIESIRRLAPFDPHWIEEPTSPDDVLGHAAIAEAVAPIRLATGEMAQNRVMFKQLLQAGAIGFCQIDACRLAGVNEVVAVLLLADRFGVPVCPHAGGVGLCEYVQHLAAFDYVAVSGSLTDRVVEYTDHLHEHFVDPVVMRQGRYVLPTRAGYSVEMHAASLAEFAFPDGTYWHSRLR
ncbi:MAG: L-fuconate dehydratase [Actinomycetota bacterium]|jgi:L-fuconate dehydratase|nr:L-fuconate dehydratase [Actinomycetota bacterium]